MKLSGSVLPTAQISYYLHYPSYFFSNSDALCPPNPREFVSAYVISFSTGAPIAIQTALFLCLFGSHGLVDESILDTFHACNKFHPAGCSQKMSDNRFRRIDNNLICRCSQCIPDCSCLIQIIVMGTRSMCIDVIDLLRLCACLFHRKLHRHPGSLSVFCRT